MSLRFQRMGPVPRETDYVARAAFRRKGHPYIHFADKLGGFIECDDFSELYSKLGQSSIHPARLALATMLQFAEGLSDRQASEQIADSILWKFVLRMELDDDGWDPSVLSEFRKRLVETDSVDLIFGKLLHVAEELGLVNPQKQRTDSTHIFSVARELNRIELVHECVRDCLEELVDEVPDWLNEVKKAEWYDRYYTQRPFNYRLPKTDAAREKLVSVVGCDAKYLLQQIDESSMAQDFSKLESVKILRRVFDEQFDDTSKGPKFKDPKKTKASGDRLSSPVDTDATFGSKRGSTWLGYKLHLTETYDEDTPHLVTNVVTTPAHVNDSLVLTTIHESLKVRGFKPKTHLVDSGYAQLKLLKASVEKDDIDVVTRLHAGSSWQRAAAKGFDLSHFVVDWKKQIAVCPAGIASDNWRLSGKVGVVNISFPKSQCGKCPFRDDCTTGESRVLQIKQQDAFEFMEKHRTRQATLEFKQAYSKRAGIEGTISQAVRVTNMRQSPYLGLEKTHLANVLKATGLNFLRLSAWFAGATRAQTRTGHYAKAFAPCA